MAIRGFHSEKSVDITLTRVFRSNDDGSGFFHTYSNVLVYGHYGQKADMAGHDNWHVGNLYAYVPPDNPR